MAREFIKEIEPRKETPKVNKPVPDTAFLNDIFNQVTNSGETVETPQNPDDINLDAMLETDEAYFRETQVGPEARKIIFHGTKKQHIDSLRSGFFTVRPTYRVFTKDIHASLTYRTGIRMEPVSDGTVTLWNPDRSMLSKTDGTTFSITNKVKENTVIPDSVPKPKNTTVTGAKENTYTQYIPGECMVGTITFSEEQKKYIDGLNKRLKEEGISSKYLQGFNTIREFLTSEEKMFPDDLRIALEKSSNLTQEELKRLMILCMYESELQKRAQASLSGKPEDRSRLESYPVYGMRILQEYKNKKIQFTQK